MLQVRDRRRNPTVSLWEWSFMRYAHVSFSPHFSISSRGDRCCADAYRTTFWIERRLMMRYWKEFDRTSQRRRCTSDSLTNCGSCFNVVGTKDAKHDRTLRPSVTVWTVPNRFGTLGYTYPVQMTPSRFTQKATTHARPPPRFPPTHPRHHLYYSYPQRSKAHCSTLSRRPFQS